MTSLSSYAPSEPGLSGRVALVAGATRGAGRAIAVELTRAGAVVYATGRTTRDQPSESQRPETIEQTAELAGPGCTAVQVDHLDVEQVRALVARIGQEHGRLDVLVNDVWGGDRYLQWNTPLWDQSLEAGLRMLRLGIETHLVTSHVALPLLIRQPGGLVVEMTDGTDAFNAAYRADVGAFYDLVKTSVSRLALGQAHELAPFGGTAVAVTPGWLRSEAMLEGYGVTEQSWREACGGQPHFCISETPTYTGRAVAALAADPARVRWAGRTVSSGELALHYDVRDADGTQPDCWRYLAEVRDAGLPADDRGYR